MRKFFLRTKSFAHKETHVRKKKEKKKKLLHNHIQYAFDRQILDTQYNSKYTATQYTIHDYTIQAIWWIGPYLLTQRKMHGQTPLSGRR